MIKNYLSFCIPYSQHHLTLMNISKKYIYVFLCLNIENHKEHYQGFMGINGKILKKFAKLKDKSRN